MLINNVKIKGTIKGNPKKSKNKLYTTLYIMSDDNKKSTIYVELKEKQWNAINKSYKQELLELEGSIEAKKTPDNKPFLYLKCNKIEKLENNKFYKPWYENIEESKFIDINPSEIYLKEKEHIKGNLIFNSKFKLKPVAIKKDEENKYYLISGFKSFLHAKILDKNLKAYITDLTIKEFNEKYRA